jgi:hypothetical protein
MRHSTANHGSMQALKVDKISEERATSDYAAPQQTAVVCKRHWRVSPRRQLQRHSRRRWGADQSQQSRRGSQQPPAKQSPVRQELPPQSREASCLATDVTGPRATRVPQPKGTRRVRMTQVHQLKVEDQQPTEVESNSHFHECLNRNHLTYVRESWTWHVDAIAVLRRNARRATGYIRGIERRPCQEPIRLRVPRITQVSSLHAHHACTRPSARGTNRRDIGQARDVNKLRYDQRRGTARIRKAIHSPTGAQI